jgi:hypothetical protein
VEWIPLDTDYVKSADIKAVFRTVKFSDMFEYAAYSVANNGPTGCPSGFRSVNNAGQRGVECLRHVPGHEVWASRFETMRYAAYLGATTEFTKMEGFDFAPELSRAYMAVTEVKTSMLSADGKDLGGPNDIRLPANPCGCVFEMMTGPAPLDGGAASSTFTVLSMRGLTCGKPFSSSYSGANVQSSDTILGLEGNVCRLDGIASPDNLVWAANHGTLFIAEDTDLHLQDFVWAWDAAARTLRRVFAGVIGAEITGMSWNANFAGSGAALLGVVVQHPYGENDGVHLFEPGSSGMAGYVGVLGPFPIPRAVRDRNDPIDMRQGWGCGAGAESCAAPEAERCCVRRVANAASNSLRVRLGRPSALSSITFYAEGGAGVLRAASQLNGLELLLGTNSSTTACYPVSSQAAARPGYTVRAVRCAEQGAGDVLRVALAGLLSGAAPGSSLAVKVCTATGPAPLDTLIYVENDPAM